MKSKLVRLVYCTNPLIEHLDVHGMKLSPQHIVTHADEAELIIYVRFNVGTMMNHWLSLYPTFKKDTHIRGTLRRTLAKQQALLDAAILEEEKTDGRVLLITDIDFINPRKLTVKKLHDTMKVYLTSM